MNTAAPRVSRVSHFLAHPGYKDIFCRNKWLQLFADGTIPSRKIGPRARIVNLDDVDAFLAGQPVGTEVGR